MKKMFYLSAAVILAFATAASAQAPDDHRGGRSNAPHPASQRAAPRGRPAQPPHAASRASHPTNNNRGANNRSDHANHRPNVNNNANSNNGNNGHANNRPSSNANNHGQPNPSYSQYQRNFTASRRYHAPVYSRPSGWYAHHWTYGEFLPSLFWAQNYWLNDFNDFGLPPPPPGTVWVRDGSDALLIDRYTGEVIQAEYNVFY